MDLLLASNQLPHCQPSLLATSQCLLVGHGVSALAAMVSFFGGGKSPQNADITNCPWDLMDERWKRFESKPGT